MERCCPSRSALRENDLSAALGSPHALPRKSGDGPHAPSTFISMSFADACRRGISGWYSGDVYQAFSAAMSGNSIHSALPTPFEDKRSACLGKDAASTSVPTADISRACWSHGIGMRALTCTALAVNNCRVPETV
jgi:hypothetical protein